MSGRDALITIVVWKASTLINGKFDKEKLLYDLTPTKICTVL